MNGYLAAMGRYASFSGRASRAEFWGFTLVAAVIFLAVLIVEASLNPGTANHTEPLMLLAMLVHFLPSLAVTARRLHDTDKSGWLLLISLVPLVGTIVLIVLTLQAGTPGANRYGVDPYDRTAQPRAPTPAAVGPTSQRDVIAEIERLAQLKANGSLSEAEFEVMKAQALGRV